MKKKIMAASLTAPVLLWIFAVAAEAQNGETTTNPPSQAEQPDLGAGKKTFTTTLSHFGLGTLATWQRDVGEPSNEASNNAATAQEDGATAGNQLDDPNQFGLLLQKQTQTSNIAVASVEIVQPESSSAADLQTLAFDISGAPDQAFGVANGFCGTGAPRFDIESDSGICALGCAQGVPTQDTTTGWWEIKFEAPFTQYLGCENGITGTIQSLSIVFDEGNDSGPGSVVLDNIRINDTVIGQPTDQRRVNNEGLNDSSVNTESIEAPGSVSQLPGSSGQG